MKEKFDDNVSLCLEHSHFGKCDGSSKIKGVHKTTACYEIVIPESHMYNKERMKNYFALYNAKEKTFNPENIYEVVDPVPADLYAEFSNRIKPHLPSSNRAGM